MHQARKRRRGADDVDLDDDDADVSPWEPHRSVAAHGGAGGAYAGALGRNHGNGGAHGGDGERPAKRQPLDAFDARRHAGGGAETPSSVLAAAALQRMALGPRPDRDVGRYVAVPGPTDSRRRGAATTSGAWGREPVAADADGGFARLSDQRSGSGGDVHGMFQEESAEASGPQLPWRSPPASSPLHFEGGDRGAGAGAAGSCGGHDAHSAGAVSAHAAGQSGGYADTGLSASQQSMHSGSAADEDSGGSDGWRARMLEAERPWDYSAANRLLRDLHYQRSRRSVTSRGRGAGAGAGASGYSGRLLADSDTDHSAVTHAEIAPEFPESQYGTGYGEYDESMGSMDPA